MKIFNFRSIQTKLIVSIIMFMVIPMTALSFFTAQGTRSIVSKKVEALTMNTLEQMNANFQQIIDNMLAISNVVEMDRDFTSLVDEKADGEYGQYLKTQKIVDKITSYLGIVLRYNSHIAFVDNDNNFYTTWNRPSDFTVNNDIVNSKWYRQTIEYGGKVLWIVPHQSYIPDEKISRKQFITMSRLVKGDRSFGKYGVLIVSIYAEDLENNINNSLASENEGFLVVNESGETVIRTRFAVNQGITGLDWCFDQIRDKDEGSFIGFYQGRKIHVAFKGLKNAGLKTVYLTPYDDIQKEVSQLQSRNILFVVAFMMLFILITVLISFTISKPIKLLTRSMAKIKDGNLDVQVRVNSRDEVGVLTENFNHMLKDLKKLMREIQKKENEKKEAHLEALQAQINPHFLFNTLNAIKWAAYVNGVSNIGDTIASLGRLFEIIIDKKPELITIKEEIEYLDNYIVLMSFKSNCEISVEYDIEPSINSFYTLKFVLQPLVENSIIHGFGEDISGGRLVIRGKRQEDSIIFTIEDNGKGVSREKIKELLDMENNSDRGRFSGIGIANVNERIKLNFGSGYGLKIESEGNNGTTVTVRIPVIISSEEGGA